MRVFTHNQFLQIYVAKLVADPFAPKSLYCIECGIISVGMSLVNEALKGRECTL